MKELTPEVKQALLAPFQAAEVRVRTYPYVAAYVTARVVMTRLDEALPWQWSFKLAGPGATDANGVMHQDGILTIHGPDGLALEFHDRGSAPPDAAKGQAKQAKHAVSDCFKRCAVHVGIGRYLYELQGVQGGRIPKSGLERALAAVGYHGPWDERHHGAIGGIREADLEDEPEDLSIPASFSTSSASSKTRRRADADEDGGSPLGARGHADAGSNGYAGGSPDRADGGADGQTDGDSSLASPADARPARGAASAASATVKVSDEQRSRIAEAVERGGGNVGAPAFRGWLAKNTANHATALDDVLAEDVEELVRKLDELAARRSKA